MNVALRLRGPQAITLAMLLGSFAWSFVYVSLPFHIQNISTWDLAVTLRWTGWILGISSLVTVATAPAWGRLATRGDATAFYVVVEALQGLAFLGMALARTLPELLLSRFVLGFMGAASTFAFIIAGRAGDPAEVRRRVAAVQSAMTVGQVIGPLAGAIAAARLGFRQSFVLGGSILLGCAALVRWAVPASPPPAATAGPPVAPARWTDVAAVSLLVLGGSTQIFFLTAILPQVLPALGVATEQTLEVGGVLIFASGVAAALGSVAAPRLAEVVSERRLIGALLVGSSAGVAALSLARAVWLYGLLRFLHVLCIAPVFPLIVARVAQAAGGGAIGIINSARIFAAFVGPVVATTLLAWTAPAAVYLLLGAAGVACLPLVTAAVGRRRPEPGA